MPVGYRPKPSFGWIWSLAIGGAILASPWLAVLDAQDEVLPAGDAILIQVLFALLSVIGAWVVLIGVLHGQMRYEFTQDALYLRHGFLLAYRIPYDSVESVERRDLRPTLWSSMRWPGLALYKVPYAGDGQIRMVSTRMKRGVTVIRAGGSLYGVSPAEENLFEAELVSRSPGLRR